MGSERLVAGVRPVPGRAMALPGDTAQEWGRHQEGCS